MAWKQLKIEDNVARNHQPFIGVSAHRITFGAIFTRMSEISARNRVSIHVDEEDFRVGFEFHDDERPHSLALVPDNQTKTKKQSGLFCTSRGLIKQYPWIKDVTKLNSIERRFPPRKEAGFWVIQLCPGFVCRSSRESINIPKDAVGIYRYVRANGEVAYVGRGNIRNRLASSERADWEFDAIEYSIVSSPELQERFESFWIERIKSMTGQLPIYNKLSGNGSR